MEIKKTVEVNLSVKDLEKIIKEYLKTKNIEVESVYFDVNGHNDENDHFAQYPLSYRLDRVICEGKEIKGD